MMKAITSTNLDALTKAVQSLVIDAEYFLEKIETQSDESATNSHLDFGQKLVNLKRNLMDLDEAIVNSAHSAVRTTNQRVHESPWTSIFIAGCIGGILTLVSNRCCQKKKEMLNA
ncbi:hypothetical protein ACO0LB_14215 [Undibacterium sp. SXout7W]|uniref:hypothetical protein n=1 Tax=Undibacterium sp. SXout7W TaxID=3413049 RepID=UPI003BF04C35